MSCHAIKQALGALQGLWHVALILFLVSSGLLTGSAGSAEQTQPIRIAELSTSFGPTPSVLGLRDGLTELGYGEDEDFVLGVRFTQGDLSALPAAARDLVQHGVDLIFVTQGTPAKAAQQATDRIPIVFATVGNPVESGLIDSFARPGGNITGVTDLNTDLTPKRLELFQAIVPALKRVLYPYDAVDVSAVAMARVYREAAHRLGIELVEQAVRTEAEAQTSLSQIRLSEVDGILMPPTLSLNIPGFMLEATAQQALPTMFMGSFWAERGGFASYGPDLYESGRQAARLVDKILKGTDPADIPVEVNSKIMFSINLKVAKALGLTIAPQVLYRADRIIR